jgi:hypothetical protein
MAVVQGNDPVRRRMTCPPIEICRMCGGSGGAEDIREGNVDRRVCGSLDIDAARGLAKGLRLLISLIPVD